MTSAEAEALRLHEDKGLTWSEMGELLGVAAGTAQDAYKRAQRKLKRQKEAEQAGQVLHGRAEAHLKRKGKLGQLTDKVLSDSLDRVIQKGIFYLENNHEIWAKAGVRELTQAVSTLTEKRQLLRGQPTSITRIEDIQKLDQLTEMVKNELERRQKVIDADPLVGVRKTGEG